MKKRLLLDGIALYATDVSPRHIQCAAAVVTHLTDAGLPVRDGAAVAAGIAAHPIAVEFLVKLAFAHMLIDNIAKGGHWKDLQSPILNPGKKAGIKTGGTNLRKSSLSPPSGMQTLSS
jgi:hypothetical protein